MLKATVPELGLSLDVAITGEEIATGLSNRDYLGEKEGMLFIIHEPASTMFWMKNMQIPVDIIFMTDNHMVVAILHNAQPCPVFGDCPTYTPNSSFSYVLEVVSGFAEKYNITPGTQIPFEINRD